MKGLQWRRCLVGPTRGRRSRCRRRAAWNTASNSLLSDALEAPLFVADVDLGNEHGAIEDFPGVLIDRLPGKAPGEQMQTVELESPAGVDTTHFHRVRVDGGAGLVGQSSH